ncbi:hypothetical protein G6F68_016103 [Rhizopus microsporus]|nr:hypothetical protein G6F68_016103 [Rhizopus microsporus]
MLLSILFNLFNPNPMFGLLMQNPVPVSQLASQPYMQCTLPNIGKEICNGLETISTANNIVSGSLLNSCNFNTENWATCFNCPANAPTVDNPTPASAVAISGGILWLDNVSAPTRLVLIKIQLFP